MPTKTRKSQDHLGPRRYSELTREAPKVAEDAALATLSSGLRIAAALSTVAAKTASLALFSMASGADKFAQLVREEATRKPNGHGLDGRRGNTVEPTSRTLESPLRPPRARRPNTSRRRTMSISKKTSLTQDE